MIDPRKMGFEEREYPGRGLVIVRGCLVWQGEDRFTMRDLSDLAACDRNVQQCQERIRAQFWHEQYGDLKVPIRMVRAYLQFRAAKDETAGALLEEYDPLFALLDRKGTGD